MAGEARTAFPAPPPYYLLFRGDDAPDPPTPVRGEFTCYGQPCNIDARADELSGSARLTSPGGEVTEVRSELKRLGRELGILILELVDELIERPSKYARRVEDISIMFRDIHHHLTALRPQQARVTILHTLETQLELRKQALTDIQKQRQNVSALLAKAAEDLEADQERLQP